MKTSKLEKGIEANNQDFKKYEQVDKLQRYRLSEGAEEEFDEDYEITTCDLSLLLNGNQNEKEKFIQDFGSSLEDIGFAILIGHDIDVNFYADAYSKVKEMFEELSLEEKMKFRAERHGSVNQGYFPIKETTIIHPDMVEGWVFCRRAFDLDENPNYEVEKFWTKAEYERSFRNVVANHEKLILPLMQSILSYLGEDPHAYDEKLTRTNFGFRLNYYPAITSTDESGGGRMLGHEDVDLLTILPASNVEGLQALYRKSMKWVRVNPPANSIIINTGDYMQRITNNRLPSTTHRVSKPRDAQQFAEPRITIPMAVYVWEDEILEVLPNQGEAVYPPIKAETFHTRITSKYYGDDYGDD